MIFDWLKNVASYILSSVATVSFLKWIDSDFIEKTLASNLMTIVVGILAVNIQTIVIIAVRLKDVSEKEGIDFSRTIAQVKISLYEQCALIFLSFVSGSLYAIKSGSVDVIYINVITVFAIIAALHIFIDTAVGMLGCLFPDD
ncbi:MULTISPECIES: hypothetical protein [Comamonas]|uniref:hypothetical protein n=1 Tax=Comamonas TaxID=283 RepID=UPI0012CBBB1A|nr:MULTISPECIES: hypothetical protein [Comamonas]MEB5966185.1 hypothetical protein [Comamonas testosteroni]MPS95189.1 hypothetical protein [Comamonas sp.]